MSSPTTPLQEGPTAVPVVAKVQSIQDLLAAANSFQNAPRPTFTYPIPETLQRLQATQGFPVVTSVTITLTRDSDEAAAAERATSISRLPSELAKAALWAVNGSRVGLGDGSTDAIWSRMHPKMRAMCQRYYSKTHYPEDEEVTESVGGCIMGSTAADTP